MLPKTMHLLRRIVFYPVDLLKLMLIDTHTNTRIQTNSYSLHETGLTFSGQIKANQKQQKNAPRKMEKQKQRGTNAV